MKEAEKAAAPATVAGGAAVMLVGRAKFQIGASLVHVRYCSGDKSKPGQFKFNINPNTLSADHELWVCANASVYYLMPVLLMRRIYNDPNAYIDRMHQEIRIVSVNAETHTVTCASGATVKSLRCYLCAALA